MNHNLTFIVTYLKSKGLVTPANSNDLITQEEFFRK